MSRCQFGLGFKMIKDVALLLMKGSNAKCGFGA